MSFNYESHNEHGSRVQYIKVLIEPHTIDLVLSYESMESHIMAMLSLFLSILEALYFFSLSPLIMLHLDGGDAQSASSPQYMQTHRLCVGFMGQNLLPWSIICM